MVILYEFVDLIKVIVKAVYISHFVLLDNCGQRGVFSKSHGLVNSAPTQAPLLCQGHVTLYLES